MQKDFYSSVFGTGRHVWAVLVLTTKNTSLPVCWHVISSSVTSKAVVICTFDLPGMDEVWLPVLAARR